MYVRERGRALAVAAATSASFSGAAATGRARPPSLTHQYHNMYKYTDEAIGLSAAGRVYNWYHFLSLYLSISECAVEE